MSLKSTLEIYELLDSAYVDGNTVCAFVSEQGAMTKMSRLCGEKGYTDMVEIIVPGTDGRTKGGNAPTIEVAGSLGGIGGRPTICGIVSDADGAVVALACAQKVIKMAQKGDKLPGDLVVRTTICTNAPTMPHHPVPFMDSYLDFVTLKKHIIDQTADAIVITETSRGNRVANYPVFGITPTVKEGWILKVSEDAIDVMERVTQEPAKVIPITMQDITPVTNGIHHLNGLGEVPDGTVAPCFGVGLTSPLPLSGAAPGVTNVSSLEIAVRYVVEVVKGFLMGTFSFYDREEFVSLVSMYGDMTRLYKGGEK